MSLKSKVASLITSILLVTLSSIVSSAEPPGMTSSAADCDSGVSQACIDVAVAYTRGDYKGKKIKKDKAKAKTYVNKAVKKGKQNCLQGDSMECYTLGLLYFEGGGIIPIDIPQGLDYLQRSCKGGYKKACAWLDNSGLRSIR